MTRRIRIAIAEIYGVAERQVDRWATRGAPVLVAERMASHLFSQNHYGATGSLLQDEEKVAEIQSQLDKLIGDDIAASVRVFERLVEIDQTISLLSLTIATSRLQDKAKLRTGVKRLTAAFRSLDVFKFIEPALPQTGRRATSQDEREPEDLK